MAKRKKSTFERLTKGPLNRKQRRELERRLVSDDPGLRIVHPNAGGIDVGNESHFAAVPADRDAQPVQEFGSWTADLHRMGKWLQSCRIDTVAVQATGVYWIPLYDILTEHGIRVVLVNAQHTKNVPGRKSDVQESQWLMKLHTYGLLRDSFRLAENLGRGADDLAVAGPARQGGGTGGAAHAEGADQNEHSVGQRDQRHQWSKRSGDH